METVPVSKRMCSRCVGVPQVTGQPELMTHRCGHRELPPASGFLMGQWAPRKCASS